MCKQSYIKINLNSIKENKKHIIFGVFLVIFYSHSKRTRDRSHMWTNHIHP